MVTLKSRMNPLITLVILTLTHFFYGETKVFSTLDHLKPSATSEEQTIAVQNLITRIFPSKSAQFVITINPNVYQQHKDYFKIIKSEDKINIVATSGVAAATGFHYYLKTYCNCHISWETSQLNLPEDLPTVNISIPLNDRFRYYQNVCTTSYSFVWWDWKQWEKHIDWMVLNSFNFVLAFNGQEAIWERVYKRFQLTNDEIDGHFTGPAFLSWLRMGNIRGWGGPLSSSWHSRSLVLQKRILKRMRSFGIIPILPAFAGHIPRAFKRLYPSVAMKKIGAWNTFNDTYCCPYFLDPTEELFNEIGKAFMIEQIAEFGTDHVYNCDSFNENLPASSDLTYLANVGSSIFKAMTDVDPKAIWLMQNWLFVHDILFWTKNRAKALLTSVPKGKMIVLDLQSEQFPQYERLNQYFGQPYIWCMLHDFGGTLGFFGSSNIINTEPFRARNLINSTMIGTGITPEGINQNYIIYDLMAEMSWRIEPTNLTQWVRNYTIRRYGEDNENATKAWQILINTVYNYSGLIRMRGKYVINRSPSLKIGTWIWYDPKDLQTAWKFLLDASNQLGDNPGYRHDLVDITRQVLQVRGDQLYNAIIKAFHNTDLEAFSKNTAHFLDIFEDLEAILATNEAFLLGPWIENAKKAANGTDEEKQFEYNARNQITLWGPKGEIMDYANKQWSGVVSHFFLPRWMVFCAYLEDLLIDNKSFNQTFIHEEIFHIVEEPFTLDTTAFPTNPTGDTVATAKQIYQKWLPKRDFL